MGCEIIVISIVVVVVAAVVVVVHVVVVISVVYPRNIPLKFGQKWVKNRGNVAFVVDVVDDDDDFFCCCFIPETNI